MKNNLYILLCRWNKGLACFDSEQDLSCQRHWRSKVRKLDQQKYNNQHAKAAVSSSAKTMR